MKASAFSIIDYKQLTKRCLKATPLSGEHDSLYRSRPLFSFKTSCILLIVILIFHKAYITIPKSDFFDKSGGNILALN